MEIKKFKDLTLADDFLFGEVMRHEEVCKPFLEKLLGKEIWRIEYIDRQKDMSDTYDAHGIRLDVYLNDELGTIYNIEMQNARDDLPKRARYYQSGIDRHTLERGGDYEDLKESYVIFVCNYDHFKKGMAVYEKVSTLRGCEGIDYTDGSHVFILNSHYAVGNADESILRFLDCVREGNIPAGSDKLMQAVKETISKVKSDSEIGGRYMTFEMKLADERRHSEAKGRAEERFSLVTNLMESANVSAEEAMDMLKIQNEERKAVLERLPQ